MVNARSEGERAIDSAIGDVYRGPLESFVSRRDAVAKDLRGSGERESAVAGQGAEEALTRRVGAEPRSPGEPPHMMNALAASIAEAVAAQSSRADVRGSISGTRTAVREFAMEAERIARNGGHDLDSGARAAALFDVLGKTDSVEELRHGRLAEVPEAGELDLLGSLPSRERSTAAGARQSDPPRVEARARADKAAAPLASAKQRAEEALRALQDAEAGVTAAEARIREVDEEAREARTLRDWARREADTAADRLDRLL